MILAIKIIYDRNFIMVLYRYVLLYLLSFFQGIFSAGPYINHCIAIIPNQNQSYRDRQLLVFLRKIWGENDLYAPVKNNLWNPCYPVFPLKGTTEDPWYGQVKRISRCQQEVVPTARDLFPWAFKKPVQTSLSAFAQEFIPRGI